MEVEGWSIWFTLNILVLVPILYSVYSYKIINLPVAIYSLGVWIFLVIGIPLFAYREYISSIVGNNPSFGEYSLSLGIRFFGSIILAIVPSYLALFFLHCGKKKALCIGPPSPSVSLNSKLLFWLFWFGSVFGALVYIYKFGMPPLFSGSEFSDSASVYRVRMGATYSKSYKKYEIFFNYFPMLAAILGHALFKLRRLGVTVNSISILLAFIFLFSFLQKSHILFLALGLVFIDIYISGGAVKKLSFGFVSLVVLAFGAYAFYMDSHIRVAQIVVMIINRVTATYFVSLDYVFSSFPFPHAFFYGKALPNPHGVLGESSVYLSAFVMSELGGKDSGTIPVPAVGSMYVNFGWAGAILASALVAAWLVFVSYLYRLARLDVALLCVWLLVVLKLVKLSNQGLFVALDLRSAFVFLVCLLFLVSFRINKKSRV